MRVFVTGGTGLIGSRLIQKLVERGDQPVVLTRRPEQAKQSLGSKVEVVSGDPMTAGPWMDELSRCDSVINLVGEGIFNKRWNTAFKQLLVDSRVKSTTHVAEAIRRQPRRSDGSPKVLVSASAIGYYGPHGDEEITEDTPPANDFLGQLCVDWEKATQPAADAGVRVAVIRVGVVLDKNGGALAKMLPPFKLCAGGPIGSGRQYMSWIHHEDMVGLFLFALDQADCTGPLNGTAPNPRTNAEFSKALGKALHRPAFVWTPGFALHLMLGEAAAIITQGQRVIPKKALSLGYSFKYPHLDEALGQIFS